MGLSRRRLIATGLVTLLAMSISACGNTEVTCCGSTERDVPSPEDEEVITGTPAVLDQIPASLRAMASRLSEANGEITVDEIGSFRIDDGEPFCVLREGYWIYSDLFFRGTGQSRETSDGSRRYNLLTKPECEANGLTKFIAINVAVDWESEEYLMELFAWSEASGEVSNAWISVIARHGPRDDILGIVGIEGPEADAEGKLGESMNKDQLDLMNHFTSHVRDQG